MVGIFKDKIKIILYKHLANFYQTIEILFIAPQAKVQQNCMNRKLNNKFDLVLKQFKIGIDNNDNLEVKTKVELSQEIAKE